MTFHCGRCYFVQVERCRCRPHAYQHLGHLLNRTAETGGDREPHRVQNYVHPQVHPTHRKYIAEAAGILPITLPLAPPFYSSSKQLI